MDKPSSVDLPPSSPRATRYDGKQGLSYFEGIAAETVGSKGICMHLLTIPPGGRAKAHLHENHETAIYVLSGEAHTWFGDGWSTTSSRRPAICSTSPPACRTCPPISPTSRRRRHRPHRPERAGERRPAAASRWPRSGVKPFFAAKSMTAPVLSLLEDNAVLRFEIELV